MPECANCGIGVKFLINVTLNEKEYWNDLWRWRSENWCINCVRNIDQLWPEISK